MVRKYWIPGIPRQTRYEHRGRMRTDQVVVSCLKLYAGTEYGATSLHPAIDPHPEGIRIEVGTVE